MLGSGNGNASATRRPPMGGDGAAGWDEGASLFAVPQSVVPIVSAPTATDIAPPSVETQPQRGPVEKTSNGDSLKSRLMDYGDRSTQTMRPPTPPVKHWSVRQPA